VSPPVPAVIPFQTDLATLWGVDEVDEMPTVVPFVCVIFVGVPHGDERVWFRIPEVWGPNNFVWESWGLMVQVPPPTPQRFHHG
jgi:hypothetical protein